MSRKLHTRPGDLRLPGCGPEPMPTREVPCPIPRLKGGGRWLWFGWLWDTRAMAWRPQWRNEVLRATITDFGKYVGVTSGRAFGTGSTYAEAWKAMCARESSRTA